MSEKPTMSDDRAATEDHYVAEVTQRTIFFDDEDRTLVLQYDADHEAALANARRLREAMA